MLAAIARKIAETDVGHLGGYVDGAGARKRRVLIPSIEEQSGGSSSKNC
jgi:hypothetical protein